MAEVLRSVGLDVGTTSTQMILSELTIENRASAFSVPEMEIAQRKILYKSPIHFTPLLQGELVDGEGIRAIVADEYEKAGISRADVDTGAIIITGETSRKENAATVLHSISDFAGDFVVATAGPDLESVLAAKGAGAVEYSTESGKAVAEKIFERHTLITELLVSLGVDADVAADDACKVEHVISDESFEAIKKYLDTHK